MKKNIFLIMLLVGVLVISGCATQIEETPKTSGEVMKVAYEFWPGTYWVQIADEKDWFKDAGLNVELSFNANNDFVASEQALAAGEIDANQLVLYDLIKFRLEGKDLVTVIASDHSFGGDQIIAQGGVADVASLKGKRIGVNQDSFQEFFLAIALQKNGLTLDDVITIQATAEDVGKFINGEVDALVTWEPHASEAKEKGGRSIFDSSQVPGLIYVGLTFHRSFIEQRPQDVQAYVNVWHKTTEFIKEHPEEAFQIIADIYDVPVGDVQAFTQQDKILDLADNKISFSYAAGFESLHGTARQINDFMIEKGITDKKLDTLDFIDARFIRNVE
jgi:NitT/TauT family transport system substrate-binding protein